MANLWWGYQHVNGSFHPKRYFSPLDVQEALESPFCGLVVGPFEAASREDAMKVIQRQIELDKAAR